MSRPKTYGAVSVMATLALIVSIGAFMFNMTPCKIAEGQTVCNAGDVESFSNQVTLQNELLVPEGTPAAYGAGDDYDLLVSKGDDSPPYWQKPSEAKLPTMLMNNQDLQNSTGSFIEVTDFDIPVVSATQGYYNIHYKLFVSGSVAYDLQVDVPNSSDMACGVFAANDGTDDSLEINPLTTSGSVTINDAVIVDMLCVGQIVSNGSVELDFKYSSTPGTITVEAGSIVEYYVEYS